MFVSTEVQFNDSVPQAQVCSVQHVWVSLRGQDLSHQCISEHGRATSGRKLSQRLFAALVEKTKSGVQDVAGLRQRGLNPAAWI
jgi:hypothetical protein